MARARRGRLPRRESFFRPGYVANLTTAWIPALGDVEDRLRQGGRIADIGCGLGASSIIMAQSYPAARVRGSDYHDGSVEIACKRAHDVGVADRVEFETTSATTFTGTGYDLVTTFDCLHDMGDPVGAAVHIRESLVRCPETFTGSSRAQTTPRHVAALAKTPGMSFGRRLARRRLDPAITPPTFLDTALADQGCWMLVEPAANDDPAANLNPVGRMYYGFSSLLCVPNALAQGGHRALGAQAGPQALAEVAREAGFTTVEKVGSTPFNDIYAVRG